MEPRYAELVNCVLCPARYKYSPTKVIKCKVCKGDTCYGHGQMVPFLRPNGEIYQCGLEWHCDECNAK